ncbi:MULTISPECIES: histidine kinase [unclassified Kitasatospora]|uniref:sensor histidine kinase n=1 Tax=unclassified Kitasatospora TaxID=2633591 RepID=UPI00070A263E|nr:MULTISPECIES: histidine kinase [unclassified Kitasatospora]KQV21723.1 histidine kinase [Kitasatospora sp. Root107]KRB75484.1 histidine kinase [Kitasatospora sp. Root187]
MAPVSRSPFTAPGNQGRGLWRALAEVSGGGLLMLLTQQVLGGPGPSGEIQLLLGAVALALLAVRRRFPVTSLLGISAVLGLLPAAGLPAAMTAYTTAKHLTVPRRRSAVLLASTVPATLVGAVFAPVLGLGSHPFGLALGAVLAATTLLVPGLLGSSGGQEDRLLRALRERAAAAEAARRLADSESRIHERSRIAAEMHDLIGHRLSVISLHTGGLEMALQKESPELRDVAALTRRSVAEAMRELREVLGVLGPLGRDTGTDALTDSTGTRSDVEALAEESRGGGIPVDLSWEGPDLNDRPAQVRRAVHRVVRESLTNVHRYAAGARVTVAVAHTDDRVEVLVRNGLPPVPPEAETGLGSGRGLVGLRERVALLGGTLEAGPTPAGGFAVTARIPARPDPGASLAAVGVPPRESPSEPRSDHAPAGVRGRAVQALRGFLGLIGVAVLMMCGLLLVGQAFPEPDPRNHEPPRIGMSRTMVEEAVYGDSTAARAAATGREPAHPESVTSCLYSTFPSEDSAADRPDQLTITRYCFRGDTLATIDRFAVPMVSRTPPWETP